MIFHSKAVEYTYCYTITSEDSSVVQESVGGSQLVKGLENILCGWFPVSIRTGKYPL